MFSRLKYPDLYCCLAKATGLWYFVASQHIIKFTHFHGQFLFTGLPLADKIYFVEPWAAGARQPTQAMLAHDTKVMKSIANFMKLILVSVEIDLQVTSKGKTIE